MNTDDDGDKKIAKDDGAADGPAGNGVPAAAATVTVREDEEESGEEKQEDGLPNSLPILPMRDVPLLPGAVASLAIGRKESVKLVDEAALGSRLIGVFAQRVPDIETPDAKDLFEIGVVAVILRMLKIPDGTVRLMVQGLRRTRLVKMETREPYLRGLVEYPEPIQTGDIGEKAAADNVLQQFKKLMKVRQATSEEMEVAAMNLEDPGQIADFVAWHMNLPLAERQGVLEEFNVARRLELVARFLAREMQIAELSLMIQSRVQEQIGRSQKEHFLREQLKAIQKELGEEDPRAAEVAEIRKKLAESKMPEAARKEAEREAARLERISPFSPEYSVAQTYLDWMVSLPWEIYTKDDFDIERVRRILDRDHFDLKKVKDRILEYVAVRKLNPAGRGPILCFVGPPGVGKTSLGRSIASALGRKFARLSLGGVRDEAEIRGHRRTYVGALPGKIIQEIRRAGSANPLIMLDEVDKLGVDFRGDPASALLEVLDPEQNFSFTDHYLGVPFDLSKVMFIVTANVMDTVPPALRDRFETISLPGYTEEEKLKIAGNYLIPRQIRENGLKPEQVNLEDSAILRIVRSYTREAGVRQLERNIASICRKIALRVAEGGKPPRSIKSENLRSLLGPERLYVQTAERTKEPGVAIGLAWTESGGDILFIESTRMKGRGGLLLTGHLGQVMQESARAALSYIRSHAESLGIEDAALQDQEIHIHVPEGATPKDGPSAGLAILASLASLFTGRPVRSDTAMTGEITLRGKILPVGGIKEKVLAARRAGIKNVILPGKNRDDVADMDRSLTKGMKFHLADTIDEVLPLIIRIRRRVSRRRGRATGKGAKTGKYTQRVFQERQITFAKPSLSTGDRGKRQSSKR